jgi:peroxiredoxin
LFIEKGTAQQDVFAVEMRNGEDALGRRQFLSAIDAFKRANAARNKESPEAWLGISRASHGLQVFPEALQSADQALKYVERPSSLEAAVRHQRALTLVRLIDVADDNRAREAEREFAAAVSIDLTLAAPSYERGIALLNAYRDAEGVAELSRYLSRNAAVRDADAVRRLIANPIEARARFAAPDFSLRATNGETFSRASLENRVVLLDFWGSWCRPCRANTPGLVALHRKFAGQIVTIGIGYADRESDWRAWIASHRMDWLHYLDSDPDGDDGPVAKAFGISGVPTYIVIDREGRIRARLDGWEGEGPVVLEDAIKRAIARPEQVR